MPRDYIRKQTLAGAERFYTAELKEQDVLIAGACGRIEELEAALLRRVCEELGRHRDRALRLSRGRGTVDVFSALAEVAADLHYCRPELHEGEELRITAGRHPMLEALCPAKAPFTPNDAYLGPDCQILLLTAPNMASKSVCLRQVALISLLGQIGSFVPAQAARLPLWDRIFTRIGAEGDLRLGRSTFLSEMIEVARVLHHATPRSLVVLDEVGRGTATADGLAIACAVLEHLHEVAASKVLFATHLHELTDCADYLPRLRNVHIEVAQQDGQLVYLHRLAPGRAERSFGVHVARMAGLPPEVVRRAEELLDASSRRRLNVADRSGARRRTR